MSLKLADVDDYINPSQACVNPLFTDKKLSNTEVPKSTVSSEKDVVVKRKRRNRIPLTLSYSHQNDSSTTSHETVSLHHLSDQAIELDQSGIASSSPLSVVKDSKATVSVSDCLACSGCITSAEAVLVTTRHNAKTLMEQCTKARMAGRSIAFTISPAALADLARVLMEPNSDDAAQEQRVALQKNVLMKQISYFLKNKFHAKLVLDGLMPLRISLIESALEFCQRYHYVHGARCQTEKSWFRIEAPLPALDTRIDAFTPSIALSATETRFLLKDKATERSVPSNAHSSVDSLEAVEVKHCGGVDSRLSFLHSYGNASNKPTTLSSSDYQHALPMLASSCPGFVCFVEKTAKDAVPNLCTVKSPMAIAGSLIKHKLMDKFSDSKTNRYYNIEEEYVKTLSHLQNDTEVDDFSVFHVSIMPCHDKKLEAERKDLAWESFMRHEEKLVPDVDLVITTSEFLTVLLESEISCTSTVNITDDNLKLLREKLSLVPIASEHDASLVHEHISDAEKCTFAAMKGTGSYADFIFRFAASALFGHDIPTDEPLPWKKGGSSVRIGDSSHSMRQRGKRISSDDNLEVSLYRHCDGTYSYQKHAVDDEEVLKFATAYGFKNIQLLVSTVASGGMKMHGYHYVEAMACPSGCLNGGGQVRNYKQEKPSDTRERVRKMSTFIQDLTPWLKPADIDTGRRTCPHEYVHTRFHIVPKLELSAGATTGVAVEDTHW
jgi:iron only hydrogenase large subunit-like protein